MKSMVYIFTFTLKFYILATLLVKIIQRFQILTYRFI